MPVVYGPDSTRATRQTDTHPVVFAVIALIVLVLIASLIFLTTAYRDKQPTTGAQRSLPAATAGQWVQIGLWRGSGPKETESFETRSGEWRLHWRMQPQRPDMGGLLQVYLARPNGGEGELLGVVVNQVDPGQDTTVLHEPPGRYYLNMQAVGADWEVSVEDKR